MADSMTNNRERGKGLILSLLLVVVFGGLLLYVADYLLHPDRLPVRRISFVGDFQNVSRDALKDVAEPYVGRNFLALDLDRLEHDLSEIPWVSYVDVSRRWPDTLQITFRETQLVARWNDDAWVTDQDTIVSLPIDAYPNLPRWSGPEGSQQLVRARYRQFANILASGGLRTDGIHYSERGAWQIDARAGSNNEPLQIRLGRRDLQERLQRFMRAYTQSLAHMEQGPQVADLRYPNGLALKWREKPDMKQQDREAG